MTPFLRDSLLLRVTLQYVGSTEMIWGGKSSNLDEAIKTILNFFIFLQKNFTRIKSIKSIKCTKRKQANKQLFPLNVF